MKLYQAPGAINPDRVVYFLRAKGALDKVELEEISIVKGEHLTKEFRSVSPFAKLPALELDDGTVITESRAVCTYLEGVFPEPNLLGTDYKERALIEMWERQLDFMWMMQFAAWFRNTHPVMAPLEKPQIAEAAEKGERNVKAFVRRVDKHLSENEFVAAGRFSNADIFAFLLCGFAKVMKWRPEQEHEHLGAWHARMIERGIAG